MTLRICLATDSTLYLPLYLAWLNADFSLKSRIRFSINSDQASDHSRDRFVTDTLSKNAENDILFSVGDIARLKNGFGIGLDDPVITGGLVDKLCVWMLGPENSQILYSTESKFRLLTNNANMTTYKLAKKYSLKNFFNQKFME